MIKSHHPYEYNNPMISSYCFRYEVRVSASAYAKYYFHMRAIMTHLKISKDLVDLKQQPLNAARANELELSPKCPTDFSEGFSLPRVHRALSFAFDNESGFVGNVTRGKSESTWQNKSGPSLGLEQLMHATHTDADGERCVYDVHHFNFQAFFFHNLYVKKYARIFIGISRLQRVGEGEVFQGRLILVNRKPRPRAADLG